MSKKITALYRMSEFNTKPEFDLFMNYLFKSGLRRYRGDSALWENKDKWAFISVYDNELITFSNCGDCQPVKKIDWEEVIRDMNNGEEFDVIATSLKFACVEALDAGRLELARDIITLMMEYEI